MTIAVDWDIIHEPNKQNKKEFECISECYATSKLDNINICNSISVNTIPNAMSGAQWLSGRELDSRPRGHWFEPHQRRGP